MRKKLQKNTEIQEHCCWHRNCNYLCSVKETKGEKIMATAIKAIPTLYGDAARRFRDMADEAEIQYERSEKKDRDNDPFVIAMREMLKRSGLE